MVVAAAVVEILLSLCCHGETRVPRIPPCVQQSQSRSVGTSLSGRQPQEIFPGALPFATRNGYGWGCGIVSTKLFNNLSAVDMQYKTGTVNYVMYAKQCHSGNLVYFSLFLSSPCVFLCL